MPVKGKDWSGWCTPYFDANDHGRKLSFEYGDVKPLPKPTPESSEGVRFGDVAQERGPLVWPIPLHN
ncbi:hypothetical protein NEUTE2DRAFT_67299 [Neurospora tetrasperma FGSC 2509]|nr:hypothetical protein NEUTE2DRAFT_67299 [Neurospora tetrasperma FGSC 2509]